MKRKDFILKIIFEHPKTKVSFSDICYINPSSLCDLKINCGAYIDGKLRMNLDLIDDWDTFKNDDLITISDIHIQKIGISS
ncbi:MAG: hypothetical protein P4L49_02355 [Desulfosporosinus sp.]|nr:hypothetical protein [Desulfosporosinus sp.]